MSDMMNIHTISDLENFLIENGIELTNWGTGYAKNLEQLFNEITNGECQLFANPIIRILPIVQVIIHADGKILIEVSQELCDQRIRERNLPPSEKMKPDEDWKTATIRCLDEELGITPAHINFITQDCKPIVRERNSQSYPGLSSQYHIYKVDVLIDSLPSHDFWTEEKQGLHRDNAILRHLWSWKYPTTFKF